MRGLINRTPTPGERPYTDEHPYTDRAPTEIVPL